MNTSNKKWSGIESLEKRFGKMNVGLFIRSFRESDEYSQSDYSKKLGISRANLCDLEKGRTLPTPQRAAKIAKKMGIPEIVLIQLALQDSLKAAKLKYQVELKKASGA